MIDIHTHLYWESYDADREDVILRAHKAGVEKMFVIGCTVEESKQSVELAEKYPEIFASIGLHPHFFNELVEKETEIQNSKFKILPSEKDEINELVESLRSIARSSNKVIAIGECGLDYYSHRLVENPPTGQAGNQQKTISEEQKMLQKEGFLAQIELAKELHLPLIIHCRPSAGTSDAYEDMFDILRNHLSCINYPTSSAILHCYMGDTEITKKFLTLPNIYFSFTANITYPVKKTLIGTKNDLTETVKMIPLDRIFAETDCPFLAPQGKRGERNEPAYVVSVGEKIAEIQGLTIDEVKQSIDARVKHIFGI